MSSLLNEGSSKEGVGSDMCDWFWDVWYWLFSYVRI